MTVEERLARLETRADGVDDWLKDIAASVRELRDIASAGRGALAVFLKVGAVVAALAGTFAWVWSQFPHK